MNGHTSTVIHIPVWSAWQSKCVCGFESDPMPTRPEAIRLHTVHVAQLMVVHS